MLIIVEKGIRGKIYHAIHQYVKVNNKYMIDYDRNKESSNLKYWNVNKLYAWEVSQNLLVDGFKWNEETSQFNEDFKKSYDEESDEGYFLQADVQYPENLHNLCNNLPFLTEKMKTERRKTCWKLA